MGMSVDRYGLCLFLLWACLYGHVCVWALGLGLYGHWSIGLSIGLST